MLTSPIFRGDLHTRVKLSHARSVSAAYAKTLFYTNFLASGQAPKAGGDLSIILQAKGLSKNGESETRDKGTDLLSESNVVTGPSVLYGFDFEIHALTDISHTISYLRAEMLGTKFVHRQEKFLVTN
jgi:hypothetical protein